MIRQFWSWDPFHFRIFGLQLNCDGKFILLEILSWSSCYNIFLHMGGEHICPVVWNSLYFKWSLYQNLIESKMKFEVNLNYKGKIFSEMGSHWASLPANSLICKLYTADQSYWALVSDTRETNSSTHYIYVTPESRCLISPAMTVSRFMQNVKASH